MRLKIVANKWACTIVTAVQFFGKRVASQVDGVLNQYSNHLRESWLRTTGMSAPVTSNAIPEAVLFGQSPQMLTVRDKIAKIAGTGVAVLIQGESGTGKDLVARYIHDVSPWGKGPFIHINCPAIPAALVEAELFGYEKGAFTGAVVTKPGRMESAAHGTLFLDEIAELEPGLQAKLLQVLQDGQFCRVGAQVDRRLETRLLCATSRVLEDEIQTGSFRQDLFYRINVVSLYLPPLRQRREDIPMLVEHFIEQCAEQYGCRPRRIGDGLLRDLQGYSWPGNIRELQNLVRRYAILNDESAIRSGIERRNWDCPEPELSVNEKTSLKKTISATVRDLERKIILQALDANGWNRKRAARALSISYRSLLYKIRDAGLVDPRRATSSNI